MVTPLVIWTLREEGLRLGKKAEAVNPGSSGAASPGGVVCRPSGNGCNHCNGNMAGIPRRQRRRGVVLDRRTSRNARAPRSPIRVPGGRGEDVPPTGLGEGGISGEGRCVWGHQHKRRHHQFRPKKKLTPLALRSPIPPNFHGFLRCVSEEGKKHRAKQQME